MGFFSDIIIPVLAVIAIIAAVLLADRRARKEAHYDEMQLKIRGEGYRLGFIVTLAALCILLFMTEMSEGFGRLVTPSFGMFAVMMTGIVVFIVYCIFREAFFRIGQNGRYYITLCLVVVAINGASAVSRITDGSFPGSGGITFQGGANLVCALSFLIILAAILIKSITGRKEAAE